MTAPERVQNRPATGDFQRVPGWTGITEKLPNGAPVISWRELDKPTVGVPDNLSIRS